MRTYSTLLAVVAGTLGMFCVTLPAVAQNENGAGAIRWKAGGLSSAAPAATDPATVLAVPADRHVVVQLSRIATSTQRNDLEAAGIRLLRYLGSNAYFAKVSGNAAVAAAGQAAGITSAFALETDWKLHPMLLRGDFPEYARGPAPAVAGKLTADAEKADGEVDTVALYVLFHPDVDFDTESIAAVERQGGLIRSTMRSINGAVIWVPLANMTALAAEDVVQWLEPPPPTYRDDAASCRRLIGRLA